MANCIIDPQRDCLELAKAELLEKTVESISNKNDTEHKELELRIRALESSQTEQKTQFGHIMESLGALKSDIGELKQKPAKRWESIVDKVLMTIVAALLGFILFKLGLGGF